VGVKKVTIINEGKGRTKSEINIIRLSILLSLQRSGRDEKPYLGYFAKTQPRLGNFFPNLP
jgi:hypothetical protein